MIFFNKIFKGCQESHKGRHRACIFTLRQGKCNNFIKMLSLIEKQYLKAHVIFYRIFVFLITGQQWYN